MGGADGSTWAVALAVPGVEDLQPIGRGGFATVYRGWQPELHRTVAVKVLDPTIATTDRFSRELRAMGAVSDHPNVVPVYEAGTVDGRGYLVMPFMPGGSLDERIRQAPLTPEEAVRVGTALAAALGAAHAAGLLHRDVKPANVLFTAYGEPKLADFGIARFTDATVTQGESHMTVAFAAPEVLDGRGATAASDVYSLGATLHAALRGEPPFAATPGEMPVATALRVLQEVPPDLREAGVPADLAAVVERAMAKDPADRHPDADALRAALDALDLEPAATVAVAPDVTQPIPVAAPVPPAATETHPEPVAPAPSPRRHRGGARWLLAGALAVVVLLAALAGLGLLGRGGDADGTATAPTTGSTARPAATGAPPTTSRSAAPTVAPSTTRPASAPAAGSPVDAARTYYGTVDAAHLDEGWALLSPAYQARTGRSSYNGFWSTIAAVEVLSVDAVGEDGALARLRYRRTNGSTTTEGARLRFVRDRAGRLLIDDHQQA